jgi:glycosyltransferase involved in cell wall biosynthesis
MIAKYYGKSYTLQTLRQRSFITREGVSMLGISDAAESIGFHTNGVCITFKQLVEDVPLPCILHWNQNHFVVCYKIRKKGTNNYLISISDPAARKSVFTEVEMMMHALPLVVTATSGLKEIVDDICGFAIPIIEQSDGIEPNTSVMVDRILYLLHNPDKAEELGKNAREKYLKYYSSDVFCENMLKVYNSFL